MSKYRCFMDFEYTASGDKNYDKNNDGIEVISIAGVVIDDNDNTVDEFYELVKPFKNTSLHQYCIDLTGITQEMVDNANSFNQVANNFMKFINKYMDKELYLYVWGDFDKIALNKTIAINSYDGEFNYIKNNIVNVQKRICCSIQYKGAIIKHAWNLQNVKKVYGLSVSTNEHNALFDARDLRDVFLAYKNKKSKNINLVKHFYENTKAENILNGLKKVMFFDYIPGELKYGLAKFFDNTHNQHLYVDNLKFNKKTLVFEKYHYSIIGTNDSLSNVVMDSEIIRYSNIQMITKVNYENILVDGYEIKKPIFCIYFTTISNKLDIDCLVNTEHRIPMSLSNMHHLFVLFRTIKRFDKLYDVNSNFKDKYGMKNSFV